METFESYLNEIENSENKAKLNSVLMWIQANYPMLEKRISWKQPMFSEHGTFIIGFSISKHHFSVAPEAVTMELFKQEIEKANYTQSSNLFRIKWEQEVDFKLLKKMIDFNREDKKAQTTFWR